MSKGKKILLAVTGASVVLLAAFVIGGALLRDRTAPEISVSEETLELGLKDGEEKLLEGVSARDDRDGDLSGSVVVEKISAIDKKNTRQVTYAVMDQGGNVGRATRTVHYKKYTGPRIRLDRPLRVKDRSEVYELLENIRASSSLDGDISPLVKYTFTQSGVLGEGVSPVELRVKDSAGTSLVIPTEVEIYNAQEEIIEIELSKYIEYLPVGAEFDPDDYYEIASHSGRLIVDSDVDTSTPGVYHVHYTVEKQSTGDIGKTTLIVVVGK